MSVSQDSTLIKILPGAGVTTFFPKSTTTGAIIEPGDSGSPNVSSSVISNEDNIHLSEHVQMEEEDEELVYCQQLACQIFPHRPKGKVERAGS